MQPNIISENRSKAEQSKTRQAGTELDFNGQLESNLSNSPPFWGPAERLWRLAGLAERARLRSLRCCLLPALWGPSQALDHL